MRPDFALENDLTALADFAGMHELGLDHDISRVEAALHISRSTTTDQERVTREWAGKEIARLQAKAWRLLEASGSAE